jgi:hypothetical protein
MRSQYRHCKEEKATAERAEDAQRDGEENYCLMIFYAVNRSDALLYSLRFLFASSAFFAFKFTAAFRFASQPSLR